MYSPELGTGRPCDKNSSEKKKSPVPSVDSSVAGYVPKGFPLQNLQHVTTSSEQRKYIL